LSRLDVRQEKEGLGGVSCYVKREQGLYRFQDNGILPCVSRSVAFIVKNIDTKILFACLVGWVDSWTVEIKKKKIKAPTLKYGLSCIKTEISTRTGIQMHGYEGHNP